MKSVLDEIEKQLDQLTPEEHILLIEELARRLRKRNQKDWDEDIAAMAADPDIQRELRQIEQECAGRAMDGPENQG